MTDLPRPPEFSADGTAPAIEASTTLLHEQLAFYETKLGSETFEAPIKLLSYESMPDGDYRAVKSWLHQNVRGYIANLLSDVAYEISDSPLGLDKRDRGTGIVRLREFGFWRRDDPVTQLAPGASITATSKTVYGMSKSDAQEFGSSIGLSVGSANVAKLQESFAQKFSRTLSISAQDESSRELRLSNERLDYYRRYAMWREGRRFEVSLLALHGTALTWDRRFERDFIAGDVLTTTSVDVPQTHG